MVKFGYIQVQHCNNFVVLKVRSSIFQVNTVNNSIEELRKIAFDFTDMADQNTASSRKSHVSKDLKKLGFTVSTCLVTGP